MTVTAPQTGSQAPAEYNLGARSHLHQAFVALWVIYAVAPIIAGADKFVQWLTQWDRYLAPVIPQTLGVSSRQFMMGVGAIEIVAGLLVAFKPRIGGIVVAAWLAGIILNLALNPNHYRDVALRDLGLMVGAIALSLIASAVSSSRG